MVENKILLGGGSFGTGREFVPENFESYNKSLDEIYQESMEDDMYLLDISGVTFSDYRILGQAFQPRSSTAKLRKLMDNTPGTTLDLQMLRRRELHV